MRFDDIPLGLIHTKQGLQQRDGAWGFSQHAVKPICSHVLDFFDGLLNVPTDIISFVIKTGDVNCIWNRKKTPLSSSNIEQEHVRQVPWRQWRTKKKSPWETWNPDLIQMSNYKIDRSTKWRLASRFGFWGHSVRVLEQKGHARVRKEVESFNVRKDEYIKKEHGISWSNPFILRYHSL